MQDSERLRPSPELENHGGGIGTWISEAAARSMLCEERKKILGDTRLKLG